MYFNVYNVRVAILIETNTRKSIRFGFSTTGSSTEIGITFAKSI